MASGFPKLPGFVPTQQLTPTDQVHFRRVSAKKQEENRDVKNKEPTNYPLPRQNPAPVPDQTGMFNPNYISTTHDHFMPKNVDKDITDLYIPDWVKMDRHVLRFYGYFKESTTESALEAYRMRKVIVFFYLEDNSVQLNEPKQTNSGIPQGAFLKRQKVQKSDGSALHLLPKDFRIGQDTEVYGKRLHIYDIDQYTREFFENLNDPQPLPEPIDQDNWEKKTLNKYIPIKDKTMKDFMEHKLGGGKVSSAKQFLENDRKVLKFYAFSGIPYIMHYYLADDTMEIREVKFQNSGRDPFPLMLRRQKLPRKFALNQPGQTYAEDFIRPQDIQNNETLDVFGRKFLINGCDPYTHNYFQEKFGRDFPISNIEEPQPKEVPARMIPPYNGFGDENDSLGYVYRLIPKPPKKDFFKWVDNQVNLRFVAKFNTDKPEDQDRYRNLKLF